MSSFQPPSSAPGANLAEHRLAGPAAEVVEHLLLHEAIDSFGDLPADATQRVVRTIAGEPDDPADRRRSAGASDRPRDRVHDIEQHRDARFVVGEVDDDDPMVVAEDVEPARGTHPCRDERRRPSGPRRAMRQGPRAAPAAASEFATLCRATPPRAMGTAAGRRFAAIDRRRPPRSGPRGRGRRGRRPEGGAEHAPIGRP